MLLREQLPVTISPEASIFGKVTSCLIQVKAFACMFGSGG
jgi:hypothetical protein